MQKAKAWKANKVFVLMSDGSKLHTSCYREALAQRIQSSKSERSIVVVRNTDYGRCWSHDNNGQVPPPRGNYRKKDFSN